MSDNIGDQSFNILPTELEDRVKEKLPQYYRNVLHIAKLKKAEAEKVNADLWMVMHQDAFAVDNQSDELFLLGMAIKFAGLHGVTVTIHGTNRETLK